ncbi:phage protein, HK97 gp10 family [Bradyrhizobium liaoningense]|uniref:phage protein, HK97 gp10 family n=1 Tax=Bradyrhizobium liaoningense TaxID=43992 RepID=UPI0004AFFD28|nr:phage protein, HK97 gp10 family [Bradyrhizobium liaoningense]
MSNNASVKQFKTDMLSLKNQMAKNFRNEFLAQGEELKGNIQAAIEHSITGHLRESVRVKDVSTDTKPSVLVIAGGSLTTKRTQAGAFDYSLAEEYGTVKQEAAPFFYPTVRGYKNAYRQGVRETFEQTLAESNKSRAIRSSGNSGAYRGALTIRR